MSSKYLNCVLMFFCVLSFLSTFASGEYNCEYKKDGFYSDDDFCHIYWRCNYGVAEEYECPAGTAWNHLDNRCDWLDNVDCTRGGTKTEKPDEEDSDTAETTQREKKTKKTTTVANDEPNETTTQLDEKDNSESTTSEADSVTADSMTSTDKSHEASTGMNSQCQSFGTYYLPDNNNCASYFTCNNGKEIKMSCPDKQLFNIETSQCEDFQQVFCGSRPVNLADKNQCSSKRDGIYPDLERGCKVFYQCISQQKVREASCPNNLKFNAMIGRCDNQANIMAPCGTHSSSYSSGSESSIMKSKWSKLLFEFTAFLAAKLAIGKLF